ncbi:MAG: PAS domain S-box protein [Deltaproteobacteria bacterium]|nr:PAS domain S-box protein [Deltaproteobacteria bacterium]
MDRDLKKSLEKLEDGLFKSPAVIYCCKAGEDRVVTFVSKNVQEQLGYDHQQFLKNSRFWVEHLHPEDIPLVLSELSCLSERGSLILEYRFLHRNGSYRWLRDDLRLIPDSRGTSLGYVGTWVDVTDYKEMKQELAERTRLAGFIAEIGFVLTRTESLKEVLTYFPEAMVRHLEGVFARVWTFNQAEQVLELQASAGLYTRLHGSYSRIPLGEFMVGRIAQKGGPYLSNDLQNDPWIQDKDWARETGITSCAGYPLIMEDDLIGVIILFARHPLSEHTLNALDTARDMLSISLDRYHKMEEVKRSEEHFKQLFESAPDPYYLIDSQGILVNTNKAAEDLTGYKREEVIGANILQTPLIPPGELVNAASRLAKRQKGESVAAEELTLCRKDGRIVTVELRSVPIESNQQTLFLGLAHDVTERKQNQETLHKLNEELHRQLMEKEEAKLQAETANKAKDDFLSNMSHELTTPLNAVIGFSEVLVDEYFGKLNEKQKVYLQNILKGGHHLYELLKNVLDISRFEAGETDFSQTDFRLKDLLYSSWLLFKEKATKAGISMNLEIAPEADLIIETDQMKLKQILMNLLSNALKFNREGGSVRLTAKCVRGSEFGVRSEELSESADFDTIIISIEDTGIGIKEEDLPKLFKDFVQLESPETKKHRGAGLGLALTRRLVELLGCQIRVESVLEKGSKFSLFIPIH